MAGIFLLATELMSALAWSDSSGLAMPALCAGGLILAGLASMGLGAKARRALAARNAAHHAAERRREAAISHGAAPGQLTEAPPENGAGDLSLPKQGGELGLARSARKNLH